MSQKTLIEQIEQWLETGPYFAEHSNVVTQALAIVIFNTNHRTIRSRDDLTPEMVEDAGSYLVQEVTKLRARLPKPDIGGPTG